MPRGPLSSARTTAVAWMMELLLCGPAAVAAGRPFDHNCSWHPGLGDTRYDFGCSFTYLSTHLNAKQPVASQWSRGRPKCRTRQHCRGRGSSHSPCLRKGPSV